MLHGQRVQGCARHLVGEDAVDAVVVQVDEPVQALHLVLAHDAVLDHARLLAQAVADLRAAGLVLEQVCVLHLLRVLGAVPPARLPEQRTRARGALGVHPCAGAGRVHAAWASRAYTAPRLVPYARPD